MGKSLQNLLEQWPRNTIYDGDLAALLGGSDDARYGKVKRALQAGELKLLRRGLYFISRKANPTLPDEFEFAPLIYSPSFVSMESALSAHSWIPEAVYTTTCATSRRSKDFTNSFGLFSYAHVPEEHFYLGVYRTVTPTGIRLMAEPWRALADYIYTRKRADWKNLNDLTLDLRIERYSAEEGNIELLGQLSQDYPSLRVRRQLRLLLSELS